ncbi:MAG: hypothetical protein ACTSQG_04175 [Promethearchaeota archaeon]
MAKKLKKVEFEAVDIEQGKAKLENLIKCYPYHPLKVDLRRVRWMWDRGFSLKVPFCGIIEQCHRKGFILIKDWLVSSVAFRIFFQDDIVRCRNIIYYHFLKLLDTLGYNEEKERIIINNSFKELNCWLNEMYEKISHLDHKGGWAKMFLVQQERIKEYAEAYRKYAKKNQKKWEQKIKKYQIEYDRLVNEFIQVFNAYPDDVKNIISSKEFDDLFTEILRLLGINSISCVNGKLKIISNTVEEIEEKRVYKYLEKYPKALENLDKAYEHKLNAEWNDVTLYCCKALENFYKNLLGNKKKFEKHSLSDLIEEIRNKKKDLFKQTDSAVMDGIDHLLLSGKNIVGTIRNSRDSGHGNIRDVLEWEAEMCYSYTILLLRTIFEIKK